MTASTGAISRSALRTGGSDWRGTVFHGVLLVALLSTLLILFMLIADVVARGLPLEAAARGAASAATGAVRNGLQELGAGDGPVDVLDVKGRT